MVKITAIAMAALAVIAPIVEANNCKEGLTYCGFILLRRGNYYDQIDKELLKNGQKSETNHILNSLFYCKGGSKGDIEFKKYCGKSCADGGDGHSDTCEAPKRMARALRV
ncbi:hypothetical protein FSARC_2623 [Fusarium sarcochroum]|uniref:Uncharacterized protein n=1 Tax=Fusarium sarcochroum TaxID=1208366 RepID=A0A8H4U5S3_9HYPO|nr:hypothetical protein FSARC_2623 [Fusarium sarcochroum]